MWTFLGTESWLPRVGRILCNVRRQEPGSHVGWAFGWRCPWRSAPRTSRPLPTTYSRHGADANATDMIGLSRHLITSLVNCLSGTADLQDRIQHLAWKIPVIHNRWP